MKHLLKSLILMFALSSCSQPEQKIVYADPSDTTKTELLIDTTAITVASLPIHFDSTDYLIYPIGQYIPNNRTSKIYMSSYGSNSRGFALVYKNGNTFSGDLDNLKFQHINSDSYYELTEKQIKIRNFTFLRSVFNDSNKQFILYTITDFDSNKDLILDTKDIESLYISNIDGTGFMKITSNFQEFVDWEIIEIQNRIYFTTSEDIDKNGLFTKLDKLHYFYYDFDDSKLIEYNPLQ